MDNEYVIREGLSEEPSEAIVQEEIGNLEILKKAALIFLQQINSIYHSQNLENENSDIIRIWNMLRNEVITRQIIEAQHKFSLALDNYLGRTILLTFVDQEGGINMYTQLGESEIIQALGVDTTFRRGHFNDTAWHSAQKLPENYSRFTPDQNELMQKIKQSSEKRYMVYREGLRRYDYNQKSESHSSEKDKRKYYYKFDKNHHVFPPFGFSRGEMAEAYINAVVKKDGKINNNSIENSLVTLYEKYINGHKDSVGAIIKGDVVLTKNGNISLAVKTTGASTAGVGQYIAAAYKIIIETKIPKTAKKMQEWLKDIPKIHTFAKQIEKTGFSSFENAIDELVSSTNE